MLINLWYVAEWSHVVKKVFCIPSPARRENPNIDWVLEPVPLVEPVQPATGGKKYIDIAL